MQTQQEYTRVCDSIKRWRTRLKRAVNMLEKLERKRLRLEKKQAKPEIGWVFPTKVPQPVVKPPSPEVHALPTSPKERVLVHAPAEDGLDIPESLRRVDPTTQLGLLGPAPGFNAKGERVPDDVVEFEKQKKLKAINRKLARKGMLRQKEEGAMIPKSKRRWDTRKAKWVAD